MRPHLIALGLGVLTLGVLSRADAQTPTIAGTWKLNVQESEDTQEQMQLAMRGETPTEFGRGYRGGGRIGVGAGSVAGGSGGGGSAGGGPPGGGGAGPSGGGGGFGGPMGRIMRPAAQLIIELTDTMIVIKDGGEIPQKIYLDGRTVQEPALTGPPADLTATWKDGKLTVDRKMGLTESIREVYSIDKKRNHMVVDVKATSARFQRPLEVKRVYEPAA